MERNEIGSAVIESEKERLSKYQVVALFSCLLLNVQDGFDILSISYSANAISQEWALSPVTLGAILSASIFGIMLGAMFLSPFADKFGRKPMTIVGLIISGLGMIGATLAPNAEVLMGSRCITGVGIGCILASVNTLVAEYAGDRYRSMAVAIFQMGFPLGAVVGGFVAAWLLDIGTWRHIFAFGALLSFIFIPVVMMLPESIEFIAKSGKADSIARINSINTKLGRPQINALPALAETSSRSLRESVFLLFSKAYWWRTALIWLAFFFLLMSLYFALSWVPKLLIEQGLSQSEGIRGGQALNLLGMIGIISFAVISTRIPGGVLSIFYLLGASVVLFFLGTLNGVGHSTAGSTIAIVAVVGFFVHASMISLYAITPTLYPAEIRATGTGWAIGLSRLGAMFGPWLTGVLLSKGWAPSAIYAIFGIPTLLAAVFVAVLVYLLSAQAKTAIN